MVKTVGDKTVACVRSGLTSELNACGTRAEWYSYVFVGSISAVTPAENGESKIQIVPEEIFLGAPANPLTVLTSQGECLDLNVGERWLFYLREVKGKPIDMDFGDDSTPLANAQETLATLRRLQKIGDFAILRGRVVRQWDSLEEKAVPNAQVIAEDESSKKQFTCIAGKDGRYEFPPLPTGRYKITARPIGSFRFDYEEIDLTGGACWDVTLSRSPHAQIGGYVRRSDGSPVPNVDVVLTDSGNSWYETTQTDQEGYFAFYSEKPGKYVLGLNFPKRPDWFNGGGGGKGVRIPPASMFYPHVAKRTDARIIRLRTDEKLDNLNFTVSPH